MARINDQTAFSLAGKLSREPTLTLELSDLKHLATWVLWMAEGTIDPIPMRLPCPACGEIHIDIGEFATRPHHTHACQHCGMVWRPATVFTVGVAFLPGFKNDLTKEG